MLSTAHEVIWAQYKDMPDRSTKSCGLEKDIILELIMGQLSLIQFCHSIKIPILAILRNCGTIIMLRIVTGANRPTPLFMHIPILSSVL